MSHRCRVLAAALSTLLCAGVIPGWAHSAAAATTPSTPAPVTAPATPPAKICDNASVLSGPATAPPGAVVVNPGTNLYDATQANPPGTTFWLAPGTHTLGTSPYNQVIPKDNNTYLGGPGAILDGQSVNYYAFTQMAVNVTIRYLTIRSFMAPGDEGVVNHNGGRGWVIERNTVRANGGAGVFLGSDNRMAYNCLVDNGQYGFQGFGTNLTVDRNEVARNNTYDWETKTVGCGCSGGAKFWGAGPATVTNNYVHDNYNVGLWADTNDVGFLFEGNYISDNRGHGILYETSYNARIVHNTFRRNAIPQGQEYQSRGDPFPIGAIYVSESGGDARVNGGVYSTLEISSNVFEDNWAGVVLWENADRFCTSPANTSTGFCTVVNTGPNGANLTTCGNPGAGGKVNVEPWRSDCRWKTQNVLVTDNDFRMDKAAIGCTNDYCGDQAVFSNWGTTPSWSPYLARTVQEDITYRQNNVFSNNRYVGDWRFVGYQATGPVLTLAQWQAAPYKQDAGSTKTPR